MNLKRALALMEEFGFDAVVATRYENLTYMSGAYVYTQRSVPTRRSAVVVTSNGDAAYIFCGIEETLIRAESWIKDLRPYREFAEDPIDMLAALLREKKLTGKRIGLERQFLGADLVDQLLREGPKASYVDNYEYFKKLRMIKEPGEISLVERAAIATRKAVEAAFADARPGDSEKQIADNMVYHLLKLGAGETALITVATGENGLVGHHMADETPIKPGQTVRTDIGGYFQGYYSDLARTYAVGEPTRQQIQAYRKLRRIEEEVIDSMVVGRSLREIYELCQDAFTREGLPFTMPHIGHSIGVELHEEPMVQPREKTVLQENMVFNIEPFLSDPEKNTYHLEDLLLVTKEGPRLLSGSLPPGEIPVIT